MKLFKYLLLLLLGTFIFSCGGNTTGKSSNFSMDFPHNSNEFHLGEALRASIKSKSSAIIDSVVFLLDKKRLEEKAQDTTLNYDLKQEKLGKWSLMALIYSEGEKIELQKQITIFNNAAPKLYSYKIIAIYPHAADAYTQGLEFYEDTLYESTGQYGRSSLRKVDFKTGKVLKSVALDKSYFGEGLSILNNKIYQLTWRENVGFIYDVHSLKKLGDFAYNKSKEGWGLANDGKKFYKSDGSEKIWLLDPQTMTEEGYIQTVTHRTISTKLNELEWVEGKIYANTYQKDGVAIINPETGAIEGLIDFHGLRDKLGNTEFLDPVNDVLNGIAYNPNTKKLYVTGKDWDKLFEVEIIKK